MLHFILDNKSGRLFIIENLKIEHQENIFTKYK